MAIKITKKIKGYSVLKPEDKAKEAAPGKAQAHLHDALPDLLRG